MRSNNCGRGWKTGDQRSNVLPIYDDYHGIRRGLTIIGHFGRTLDGCERSLLIYLVIKNIEIVMYSGWQDIGRNVGRTLDNFAGQRSGV